MCNLAIGPVKLLREGQTGEMVNSGEVNYAKKVSIVFHTKWPLLLHCAYYFVFRLCTYLHNLILLLRKFVNGNSNPHSVHSSEVRTENFYPE